MSVRVMGKTFNPNADFAGEFLRCGAFQRFNSIMMLPDHPRQLTIFVSATKDVSYGMEAAWRERHLWKTKASSLDKYVTAADAALFAVDMIMRDLIPTLSRADHCSAEIVTELRLALTAIETAGHWTLPVITDIRRQTSKVEDAGGRVTLSYSPFRRKLFARSALDRLEKELFGRHGFDEGTTILQIGNQSTSETDNIASGYSYRLKAFHNSQTSI